MSETQDTATTPKPESVAELRKQLAKADARLEAKDKKIAQLSRELQVKEATKGSTMPTKELEGESYIATLPRLEVKLPDGTRRKMTAEEIAANDAVSLMLLHKKSCFWRKVELKKKK